MKGPNFLVTFTKTVTYEAVVAVYACDGRDAVDASLYIDKEKLEYLPVPSKVEYAFESTSEIKEVLV